MYLERPANYRGPGTRNVTATANVHATTEFCAPSIAIVLAQIIRKIKIFIIGKVSGYTGSCAFVSHNWAHSRFEPAKLKFHFRHIKAGLINSGPWRACACACFCACFCACDIRVLQRTSVPRLLNCVLRYIRFARPAPWRVSAMLV